MTLVEIMVGMAVGLIVVALGLAALAIHLKETRNLNTEMRLMQDLRNTTELVARHLRRAGAWNEAFKGVWSEGNALPQTNPHVMETGDGVTFSYGTHAALSYRLNAKTVEMKIGNGSWQALTDPGTMQITAFDASVSEEDLSLDGLCPLPCDNHADCSPKHRSRVVAIVLEGQSVAAPKLTRTARATVHVRNGSLVGACAA